VGFGAVLEGYEKLLPPRGFDPLTFQPVTSRYTDYAIPAAIIIIIINPIILLVLSTTGIIQKQIT
jgi:hypothetical protein